MKLREFGLLGRNIDYSFSRTYFAEKFQRESIEDARYRNFDFPSLDDGFEDFLDSGIAGMNVTIPYKEAIIPYLDEVDSVAQSIGAVNTVQFVDGKKIGFNTDAFGFQTALEPMLMPNISEVLILGTGGASKAAAYVCKSMGMRVKYVTRNPKSDKHISYEKLCKDGFGSAKLIVNASPVGTFPNIENAPQLPYALIDDSFILFDMIYNPAETLFLRRGKSQGAKVKNGLEMLVNQAEKAWEIWNK